LSQLSPQPDEGYADEGKTCDRKRKRRDKVEKKKRGEIGSGWFLQI
jgi:hypothetical protein